MKEVEERAKKEKAEAEKQAKARKPKRYINGLPEGWWEDSKGVQIDNFAHYKKLMMKAGNPNNNKHVFIDMFMEECHFCFQF